MTELKDVQKTAPKHLIPIDFVGISGFKLPISVGTKSGSYQTTIADVSVYGNLPATKKGIDMSRIPIAIQKFSGQSLDVKVTNDVAEHIRRKLEVDICKISYKFPYFVQKIAPVSKEPGIVSYDITFDLTKAEDSTIFIMKAVVVGTSLCPCSKEISNNSAHNQRAIVEVSVKINNTGFLWIEDLIELIEMSCSGRMYSVLKRVDEKAITEFMYDNPKFVEDIVRDCAFNLSQVPDIFEFNVKVSSEESIHQHNAVAILSGSNETLQKY